MNIKDGPHIPVKAIIPTFILLAIGIIMLKACYPGYGMYDELPSSSTWLILSFILASVIVIPFSIRIFSRKEREKERKEIEKRTLIQIEADEAMRQNEDEYEDDGIYSNDLDQYP